MKKSIYLYLFLVLFYFSGSTAFAQLLVENFNYPAGNNLTDHGWTVFSSGTDPVTVASSGLSYTNYPSGNIGNAALLDAAGQSVYKTFTEISSASLYVSFLINASDAVTSVGFNSVVVLSPTSNSGRYCRVFIIKNSSTNAVKFGLQQFTESTVYTPFDYSLNTTYLVVMKYTFVAGSQNDTASLFVFADPNLPSTEPTTPTLGPVSSGNVDPVQLSRIVLRQPDTANILTVDGIRVGLSWSDEAPLPVELTSFSQRVLANGVELSWATATETNNFGFEVQRKSETKEWEKIGFVEGYGTTVKAHSYHFTDETELSGSYLYRLKQIDTDGNFEFSPTLTVAFGIPESFDLAQNYPNPFNPSTSITYSIASDSHVQLTIFDVLGKTVRTLVDENRNAGNYSLIWNGKNDSGQHMPSGTYFYQLRVAGNPEMTRQMQLIK